jgi:pimeloyl-ACP methyl ester carboxylesterase
MTSAQLRDVTIEYEVDGPEDGEPMLLLMGLGTQLVAWPSDLVDGLAGSGFRVIRMDNRDIGLSTKTEGPVPTRAALVKGFAHRRYARAEYLLSDMAEDAAALLDHLSVPGAHVVGVSMGGMIAQQLTIDHPDLVHSLCSIMSNTGSRRHGTVAPRLLPTMAKSMSTPRPADPAEAERLGVEGFRIIAGPHFDADEISSMVRIAVGRNVNPLGTIRQLVAIQASPDRTPGLREVSVPTLVVHGLLDQLVLPSGGIATARAVPGSRLLMFPDMAHDLPKPRRAEIVEEIVRNARRAQRPSSPGSGAAPAGGLGPLASTAG